MVLVEMYVFVKSNENGVGNRGDDVGSKLFKESAKLNSRGGFIPSTFKTFVRCNSLALKLTRNWKQDFGHKLVLWDFGLNSWVYRPPIPVLDFAFTFQIFQECACSPPIRHVVNCRLKVLA